MATYEFIDTAFPTSIVSVNATVEVDSSGNTFFQDTRFYFATDLTATVLDSFVTNVTNKIKASGFVSGG